MTTRLSTGLRANMLNGGTSKGMKGSLDGGFIYLFAGPQPLTADLGSSGHPLLGKVTKNGDGTTGLTFDATTTAILSKAAAETWKAVGLAAGTIGWARFCNASDDHTLASTTYPRIDMAVAVGGTDLSLSTLSMAIGTPTTIDVFSYEQPTL